MKENKQLKIQQKQNYPDSVAVYDTQPGDDVGLFYNRPEHHTDYLGRYNKCLTLDLFTITHSIRPQDK